MSFLEKFKNRLETIEKKAIEASGNEVASDEVIAVRIALCNNCEHLFKLTKNCKKCGCFVDLKTKMAQQKCPIDKW